MVHHTFFFVLFFLVSLGSFAQDERYYRQILGGDLPKLNEVVKETQITQFSVKGSSYKFDLNGDKMEETIEPQKRDGVDWIEIRNSSGTKIFEAKLLAMGVDSEIYKIKLVNLSKSLKAAIIFLDEGVIKSRRFESTARIFVISFESNDLQTMKITEGPHFFHEKEGTREQYWRRDFMVNIYDMDGDGTREIAVQYNHIQRIMKYVGRGEWQRF